MKRTPPSTATSAALLRLPLFTDCTLDDVASLLQHTDLASVSSGRVLAIANEHPRQFVGIVDGYVAATSDDGTRLVLGPGDQVGAAELFADARHTMTFTTTTRATLVVVFGPMFHALARHLPGVAQRAEAPDDVSRLRLTPLTCAPC